MNKTIQELIAPLLPGLKVDIEQPPGGVALELEPHHRHTEANFRPRGTLDRGTLIHTVHYAVLTMESGDCYPASVISSTFRPHDAEKPSIETFRSYTTHTTGPTDFETAKAYVTQSRAEAIAADSSDHAHRIGADQDRIRMSV